MMTEEEIKAILKNYTDTKAQIDGAHQYQKGMIDGAINVMTAILNPPKKEENNAKPEEAKSDQTPS